MLFVAVLYVVAAAPAGDALPPGLSEREVADRAAAEFDRGVKLCPADQARPHFRVELCDAADQARPHFRAAADLFDELRRRGASSPDLYRSLGNACLLADDLPHAVLAYRRGLRLAPDDADLQAGLEEARQRVSYPAGGGYARPAADRRPPWLPRGGWWAFGGAALCYAAAWLCATRWWMTRRGRLLAAAAVALATAAALTAWLVVLAVDDRRDFDRPLVVVAEDGVVVRKGDGLAFPPCCETPLNKGVEARRLFQRGDWVQVELGGGEVGWVPRDAVLVDEP
jgi:hypothetical protein